MTLLSHPCGNGRFNAFEECSEIAPNWASTFFSKEANTNTVVRPCSIQGSKIDKGATGAFRRDGTECTLHCLFCYLGDIKSRLKFLLLMIWPLSSFLHVGKGQTNSKWFFQADVSSKKRTNKFDFTTCFRSFFGRKWRYQKDISKLTDLYHSITLPTL